MNATDSIRPVRWWLCGLLFVATALSFLDRQVLSVLAPVITQQLGMSNVAYAHVTTAFLVSYALMFVLGGRLMDVVGTRLGMALSVGLWSVASAAHAVVQNAFQLGVGRFLLGVGEGGCFPGAAKGVAEWFPQRERALAMGIAIGGASLGAVVAPPLTVWLANLVGWRGVFVTTGLLGATWVVAWWSLWRAGRNPHPDPLPHTTAASRGLGSPPAGEGNCFPLPRRGGEDQGEGEVRLSMMALLRRGDVWGLALMRFVFDPVFYFYMFWIPKYLNHAHGVSQQQIGNLVWIPFLALGLSNAAGGWVSDRLIQHGLPALTARRVIMAAAAVVTIASSLTGLVKTVPMALAMMSLLMFAHGFWITNYVTLISDRFPKSAVGTVMGIAGTVGAFGGILANFNTGWIVDKFSYGPLWLASGVMYPLAFLVLLATIRPARQSS